MRRLLLEELRIPVYTVYQAVEALRMGFECEAHAGVHVNCDLHPLRIVDADGRTAVTGEVGEVVVSNLVNRATVVLNYRLGDLAATVPGPCSCGRNLPSISFPAGRRDDWVTDGQGAAVHPHALIEVFRSEPALWQYQVTQKTAGDLLVSLVVAPECDRTGLRERIRARIGDALGSTVPVEVAFVADVPRTAAGKCRAVVVEARAS